MTSDGQGAQESLLVVFRGEYDLASKARLRQELRGLASAPRVALDFTDVTYIDSTMIEEMVTLRNARAAAGLEPETIVLKDPNLLRIFEMLDLSTFFRFVTSVDDAMGRDGAPMAVKYAPADD
jgi:anti-anti-sigma factor